MKTLNKKQLPRDIDTLQDMVLAHQNRIQLLEEQIILFNHSKFGKSSETCTQQAELFDEAEQEADAYVTTPVEYQT
jgi:hypothetical protein